jgi:hypothetical protein
MKRFYLTIAGLAVAASAAPAWAQYADPGAYDYRERVLDREADRLRMQIDDSVRRGTIARADASGLLDELAYLRRVEEQYRRGGLSSWERRDLQRRLDLLRERIRYTESDGRGRYDSYDRNDDQWGRDDRWGGDPDQSYRTEPYRGPGGFEDPYGTDRRWEDRGDPADGQDWFEPDLPPGDAVPGREPWDSRDAPGYPGVTGSGAQLRVGDRAPPNLSPVPPEYRSRYQDGGGLHYRYDDGRIFQIDERTGTIRWIGELPTRL